MVVFMYLRYRAVVLPLDQRTSTNRGKLTIGLIWVCAMVTASPLLVTVRSYPFPYGNNDYWFCDETWSDSERLRYTIAILCVTYVVPLLVIASAYLRILLVLRNHKLPGNTDQERDRQNMKTKRKVQIM